MKTRKRSLWIGIVVTTIGLWASWIVYDRSCHWIPHIEKLVTETKGQWEQFRVGNDYLGFIDVEASELSPQLDVYLRFGKHNKSSLSFAVPLLRRIEKLTDLNMSMSMANLVDSFTSAENPALRKINILLIVYSPPDVLPKAEIHQVLLSIPYLWFLHHHPRVRVKVMTISSQFGNETLPTLIPISQYHDFTFTNSIAIHVLLTAEQEVETFQFEKYEISSNREFLSRISVFEEIKELHLFNLTKHLRTIIPQDMITPETLIAALVLYLDQKDNIDFSKELVMRTDSSITDDISPSFYHLQERFDHIANIDYAFSKISTFFEGITTHELYWLNTAIQGVDRELFDHCQRVFQMVSIIQQSEVFPQQREQLFLSLEIIMERLLFWKTFPNQYLFNTGLWQVWLVMYGTISLPLLVPMIRFLKILLFSRHPPQVL